MGFVKNIFRAVVTGYIVKQVADNIGTKFWHFLKFKIPFENIRVSFPSISEFLVTLDFIIENATTFNLTINDLHTTVFYPNAEGDLIELASTPPNGRTFHVRGKDTTTIRGIQVKVISMNSIGAIKAFLQRPEGERLKIMVTGSVKGFNFEQSIWY